MESETASSCRIWVHQVWRRKSGEGRPCATVATLLEACRVFQCAVSVNRTCWAHKQSPLNRLNGFQEAIDDGFEAVVRSVVIVGIETHC